MTDVADLPPLTADERDDAAFRAKDLGWAALVRVYDEVSATQPMSYQKLGARIRRSRSHVQRWLSSPFNLSLSSLGLLAEGLNADLMISLRPRTGAGILTNFCHPSEAALGVLSARTPAPLVTTNLDTAQPGRFAEQAFSSTEDNLVAMDA